MSQEESDGTTDFAGSSSQSGKRDRCESGSQRDSPEEPLQKQPKLSEFTENFNAVFQRLEDETIISLQDMRKRYLEFFGFIHDDKLSNFLVTESFKRLLTKVRESMESSQAPIIVRGPKGVGKTTSLIALHSLLISFVDVVYVNDKALNIITCNSVGKECVEFYYRQFLNDKVFQRFRENERDYRYSVRSVEMLKAVLTSFVTKVRPQSKPSLMLVDLSKCDNTDDVQFISDVCCGARSSGVCVVLSISSGEESKFTNATVPLFDKLVPKCRIVYFQPFSDSEVKEYLAKNKVQFSFELDLKHLTGYNPFLLEMATTESDLSVLDDRVSRFVNQFVNQCFTATKSSTGHDYLVRCIAPVFEYFYMAANEIPLDDKRRFRESWICQQGVCYITDKEDKQYVTINFPTAPDLIRHEIDCLVQNDSIKQAMKNAPAVHGYLLQQEFFQHVRERFDSEICLGNDGGLACYQLDFVDIREYANQMQCGVLYCLRLCHPAFDAIMLSDCKLLFFKISNRKYGTGGIEIGNLMEVKYACKGLQQGQPSLFEYYKSIAKVTDNSRCSYVYLSTATTCHGSYGVYANSQSALRLKNDAKKFNIGYGLLKKDCSDLYKRFTSVMF